MSIQHLGFLENNKQNDMKQEIRLPKGYELKELEKGVYEIVKSEFKLENGKDYVHVLGKWLIINRIGDEGNLGFTRNGERFDTELYCSNPKDWRESTEEEAREFFERHLIKRYGEDWMSVKLKECMHQDDKYTNVGLLSVDIDKYGDSWMVWNKNGCLFNGREWAEVLEEIPTIELRGLDKKWKWCAMDDNRAVFIFESKPNNNNAFSWWNDRIIADSLNCKYLDQSQFTELKKLNWKGSLHKIKHV